MELVAEISVENIGNAGGFEIAFVGMTIVFVALALIAGGLTVLPRILAVLEPHLPAERDHHHDTDHTQTPTGAEDQAVVVALAAVLHQELQSQRRRES